MKQIKAKYYLNPDNLTFQKEANWTRRNRMLIIFLLPLVLIASIVGARLILSFYGTPKEILLINENKVLLSKYGDVNTKLNDIYLQLDSINAKDDSIYRAIFGVKPIEKSIRQAGIGGSTPTKYKSILSDTQLVNITSQRIKDLEKKLSISAESYREVLDLAKQNAHKMQHIPAIMPISNKTLKRTGSGFGMRYHPILNITRMHEGQDFVGDKGTYIFATADGKVKRKYKSKTFGNVLIIDHGYGYETYYAHLQKYNVNKGELVKRGDHIGYMGSTGLSSGSHLHYEVHLNGIEVDPVNYFYNDLSAEEYNKIIEIAQSFENSMD